MTDFADNIKEMTEHQMIEYARRMRQERDEAKDDVDDLHQEIRLAVEALDSWMAAGKLPGNLIMVIERLRSLLPEVSA